MAATIIYVVGVILGVVAVLEILSQAYQRLQQNPHQHFSGHHKLDWNRSILSAFEGQPDEMV